MPIDTFPAFWRRPFFAAGLLFMLSGATSLAYEVVWVKVLSLHLGNAAWSIATVVASFMAGLGLGSAWAGRRADQLPRPLRTYAALELGIALFGAVSLPLLEALAGLLSPLYGLNDNHFALFVTAQFLLSFIMLVVPTFLMGASLPVLVAAVAQEQAFRRSVSLLYGINTLGAAMGTLATGLFFIPALGVSGAVWVAVLGGGFVALGALVLDRHAATRAVAAAVASEERGEQTPRLLLVALAVVGCLGILYQIAWTRLLLPVVGSSTYAFTIILTTVLLGIGIGALLVAVPRFREKSCWQAVAIAMGVSSCSALAGLFAINALPQIFVGLVLKTGDSTWLLFLMQSILAASIIFVPACSMGAALPLGIAAWRSVAGSAGRAVGGIYAANTAGAIVGSVLAGFVLLPRLGATGSIQLGAIVGVGVAAILLLRDRELSRRVRAVWIGSFVASCVALSLALPEADIANLQRGVFRRVQDSGNIAPANTALLYAREGSNATVTVFRTPNSTVLKVNGKADASTGADVGTQYLLGHLPMFLHPAPPRVCVIGYGSGATVYAAAVHAGVEVVDVVEIEGAVIDASAYFESINYGVLDDRRVRLYTEDGRNFLRHRKGSYDVIISEPSNPWIAGVSSLFTVEFYRMVQQRLAPQGVFCQWIQAYEISAETTRIMLHTLATEFDYIAVFRVAGDYICVASSMPIRGSVVRYAENFSSPAVRESLRRAQIDNAFDLFAGAYIAYPNDAESFAAALKNTDDNLWLEYRAPIEMYQGADGGDAARSPELYWSIIEQLFPDMDRGDLALGIAQSIATKRAEDWSIISAWRSMFSGDQARLSQLEALAQRGRLRTDELARNQERERLARNFFKTRKYAEAIPLFAAIVALEKQRGDIHRLLAWSLTQMGRKGEAWRHYEAAIAIQPEDFEAHTNMAALALSDGLPTGEQMLQRSLAINPRHFTSWRLYVQYHVRAKRWAEAEALIEKAGAWLEEGELARLAGMLPK